MIKFLQALQQSFPFGIGFNDDVIFTSSWCVGVDGVIKNLLIQKGFGFSKIKNIRTRNIDGLFGLADEKKPIFKNLVVLQKFSIENLFKIGNEPFI